MVSPRRPGVKRSAVRAGATGALTGADTRAILPEAGSAGEADSSRRARTPASSCGPAPPARASPAMLPPGTSSPTVSAPMSKSASRLTIRVNWLTLSALAVRASPVRASTSTTPRLSFAGRWYSNAHIGR